MNVISSPCSQKLFPSRIGLNSSRPEGSESFHPYTPLEGNGRAAIVSSPKKPRASSDLSLT